MYHDDSRGWSEVKGVEVVVCVVVRDKGCEVGVVVYVEYGDRVK
jgi:hypothetical protein